MKSSNPVFSEDKMNSVLDAGMVAQAEPMTVNGAINKTLVLMGVMLATALLAYSFPIRPLMYIGIFGGAGVMWYASSNLDKSPVLAPIFAGLEGLVVGYATYAYSFLYNGIIFQAVTATFTVLFVMLMLYKSGLIEVNEKFRSGVSTAVGAVMLFYGVSWVLSFFGITIPYVFDGGPMSIGLVLVIIGIASLNLLLDFDNFETGEEKRMPDYMEWYFGMGLLFTLVWLYLEILRLLSYLSND